MTEPTEPTERVEREFDTGVAPAVDAAAQASAQSSAQSVADEAAEEAAYATADVTDDAEVSSASSETAVEPAARATAPPKRRRFLHLPRTRRGWLALALMLGAFGLVGGVGTMMAVNYSESASFCSSCHTMQPQVKAYQVSAHRDVACGECHIRPGVGGFVSAKINGMSELYELVRGTYPRPITLKDRDELPPVKQTCLKCHSIGDITKDGGPVKLVLRLTFRPDAQNTREQVAVVLRPAGLGEEGRDSSPSQVRGVHWHVQQQISYTTADKRSQKIDLVEVTLADGTTQQYLAGPEVGTSDHAANDISRLERTQTRRVMDCIDCHNRVGHRIPSVDSAVDASIASGKISAKLPYVKRDAVAVIGGNYPTQQAADEAIDALGSRYALQTKVDSSQISSSVAEIKRIYHLVATPNMQATATTYADNIGHQTSPGCFRCHDGAHYLVVQGKVTNKTIPSGCATCHTFPQVGPKVSGVLVGGEPQSHSNKLFAFDHKKLVGTTNPTGTSCGTCHVPTYCQNCHNSGAINVKHDVMLYRHGVSARAAGVQSCAYCHQPVSCAQCHKGVTQLLEAKPP